MKNDRSKEKYIIDEKQSFHEYSENINKVNDIVGYENIYLENLNNRIKKEVGEIVKYLEEIGENSKSEWLKNWIKKKPLQSIDNILKEEYSNGEISFIDNLIKKINNVLNYFNVINNSKCVNKNDILLNFILQIPSMLCEYAEEHINSKRENKKMLNKVDIKNIYGTSSNYKIENNISQNNYEYNIKNCIIAA